MRARMTERCYDFSYGTAWPLQSLPTPFLKIQTLFLPFYFIYVFFFFPAILQPITQEPDQPGLGPPFFFNQNTLLFATQLLSPSFHACIAGAQPSYSTSF